MRRVIMSLTLVRAGGAVGPSSSSPPPAARFSRRLAARGCLRIAPSY